MGRKGWVREIILKSLIHRVSGLSAKEILNITKLDDNFSTRNVLSDLVYLEYVSHFGLRNSYVYYITKEGIDYLELLQNSEASIQPLELIL